MSKCTCSFAQRVQGDGCEACNPEKVTEIFRDQLADAEQRVKVLEEALLRIIDMNMKSRPAVS